MGKKYPKQGQANPRKGRWKGMKKQSDLWSQDRGPGRLVYFKEKPKYRLAKSDGTGELITFDDPRHRQNKLSQSRRVATYGAPFAVAGYTAVKLEDITIPYYKDQKTESTRKVRGVNQAIAALAKSAFEEVHAYNKSLPEEDRYIIYSAGFISKRYIGGAPRERQILRGYGDLWTDMGISKKTKKKGLGYKLEANEAWKDDVKPTSKRDKKVVVDKTTKKAIKFWGHSNWRNLALEADVTGKNPKTGAAWDGSSSYPKAKQWATNTGVSNHAFGIATDVNYAQNGHDRGWTGKDRYEFDIPPWFVEIFMNHGFYWGGLYNGGGDYMHFEYTQKHVLKTPVPPLPRPGARKWVQPVPDKTAEELCALNEAGNWGFFPVGRSNTWHGGVHIPIDSEVRCLADGRIVAARLPEKNLGRKTGNSFVLVRHELPVKSETSEEMRPAWSLYAHLRPFAWTADNSDAPAWVQPLLSDVDLPEGLEEGKRYYETLVQEDKKGSVRRFGLNMRRTRKGKVVAVLPPGTLVEELVASKNGWPQVKVVGGEHDGEEGVICVTYWRKGKTDRVKTIDTAEIERAKKFKAGAVIALDVPIKAGESVGRAGLHGGETAFHVEVFSETKLHEGLPELKVTEYAEDEGDDALLDDDKLIAFVESVAKDGSKPGFVTKAEAKQAAKALREKNLAVRFTTEWGAGGWERLEQKPWKLKGKRLESERRFIKLMQWWDMAEKAHEQAKSKDALPGSKLLWHYHPITLVTQLQEAYERGSQAVKV